MSSMTKSLSAPPLAGRAAATAATPIPWNTEVMIGSVLTAILLCHTAVIQHLGYKAGLPMVAGLTAAMAVLVNRKMPRLEMPRSPLLIVIFALTMSYLGVLDAIAFLPLVGFRGAAMTFVIGAGLAAFFLLLSIYVGTQSIRRFLAAVALGIGWFAGLNLLASSLGFGGDRLWERETLYTSWYSTDRFRWQSSLISGGTLSGMARFALPMLLYFLWESRRGKTLWKLVFAAAAVMAGVVLVRTELRNAILPPLGLVVWMIALTPTPRALVAASFCAYTVLAPLLWTSHGFRELLEQSTPDLVIRALGNQAFEDMITLTGRTDIWQDGVEHLARGTMFFVGTGQSSLSSANYSPAAAEALSRFDPEIVPRLDFHQGFLDLCFIAGTLPACLMVGGLALLIGSACLRERGRRSTGENGVALLALGMAALSNAHDGYLTGTSLFLFIAGITALWIHGRYAFAEAPLAQRQASSAGGRRPWSKPAASAAAH